MLSQFISTAPIIKGSDRWNELSSNWFSDSGTLAFITYDKKYHFICSRYFNRFYLWICYQQGIVFFKSLPWLEKKSQWLKIAQMLQFWKWSTKQSFCPLEIICSILVLTISCTTQSRQYKNINSMFDFVLKFYPPLSGTSTQLVLSSKNIDSLVPLRLWRHLWTTPNYRLLRCWLIFNTCRSLIIEGEKYLKYLKYRQP